MKRVRNFLLCVVLLALAGILHHEWTQMTGSSGIEPEVQAAVLSNFNNQACNGSGTWHFVNPQADGNCQNLTVLFSCDGNLVQKTATVKQCNTNTTNYNTFTTSGNCSLLSAFNGAPGKIVLSDYQCVSATPTPTPTPTPEPTPTPTP